MIYAKEIYIIKDREIEVFKVNSDYCGNARYVIHYLVLSDNYSDKRFIKMGLKKYTAKWYGGGLVFQSCNVKESLKYFIERMEVIK